MASVRSTLPRGRIDPCRAANILECGILAIVALSACARTVTAPIGAPRPHPAEGAAARVGSAVSDAGDLQAHPLVTAEIDAAENAARTPKCASTPTQLLDLHALFLMFDGEVKTPPLVVSGEQLFFIYGTVSFRMPVRGGTPIPMARGDQLLPRLIASPPGFINAIGSNGEQSGIIQRVTSPDAPGVTPLMLASTAHPPFVFTADAEALYFADGTAIESVAFGGAPKTLTVLQDGSIVSGLTVVDDGLVITMGNERSGSPPFDDEVVRVPLAGGAPEVLATNQPGASFPMSCGDDTCWWMISKVGTTGASDGNSIARLTKDGALSFLTASFSKPTDVVFDGTDFYATFDCVGCPGTLMRIPLSDDPPTEVVAASHVAVDDECIYYSQSPAQTGIFSVQKSYAPVN